jgi:septum formation topological specificity factor MinE
MYSLIITIKIPKKLEPNLFDSENIAKEKTFRINSKGMMVIRKDLIKFVCKENELEENSENLILCKDEVSICRVNISPKSKKNLSYFFYKKFSRILLI